MVVAHRGTFFCDEFATRAPACQAKLLRAVEEGSVRRVGGLEARPAAPRWIVACQRYDAARSIAPGVREDLWYRLSTILIRVPPLRQRRGDIPALVAHFLNAHALSAERVERGALELLVDAAWRGNVRELKHVVARLAMRANGSRITPADVRGELHHPGDPDRIRERTELLGVLESHEWNLQHAARTLGIARGTLYRRLRVLGVERPEL